MSEHPLLASIRHRLSAEWDRMPENLLHDVYPCFGWRGIVLADLIGRDDQVDHEWMLPRVLDEVRTPIPAKVSLSIASYDPTDCSIRTASYRPRGGWTSTIIDAAVVLSEGLRLPPPDPTTFQHEIRYVRYFRA